MSSIRVVSHSPSFQLLTTAEELKKTAQEIQKINPIAEVSIEGLNELATGTVTEWHEKRNFFVVKWNKKSEKFESKTESESGLRCFFKLQLFSTQIVFKSTTLRRVSEEVSHYRIPEQLYSQQRRGALRVPVSPLHARVITPKGEFPLLNLSVAGARAQHTGKKLTDQWVNVVLDPCEIVLGRKRITNPKLGARITHVDEHGMGFVFHGLTPEEKVFLKQYLVEALHRYFNSEKNRKPKADE